MGVVGRKNCLSFLTHLQNVQDMQDGGGGGLSIKSPAFKNNRTKTTKHIKGVPCPQTHSLSVNSALTSDYTTLT